MDYNSQRKPFFYDITLRDGNQALKKPWNTDQKEIIFKELVKLGVQAVEVGFSGSSDMDFEACQRLASIAPDNIVIAGLARAVEKDIIKVAEAIKSANKPRIHTFIAMSPFNMKYVLKKDPMDVRKTAVEAIKYAKSLMGEKGEVQFSVEHFGDCADNLNFVIDSLHECIEAGATTINLPNTVERNRPFELIRLVEKVKMALPDNIIISAHNHNDLGMATATTVESYFVGATQLECSLNGLGERAGNTNMYEVAIALHNSGVEVPLNLSQIYETAILTAEMANVPICEKAPLIGEDALAHRSGIHQDGAVKTQNMKKGAYRPIHPSLIGRDDAEKYGFTSQSGKTALYEIIKSKGYPITVEETIRLVPIAKEQAEKYGELPVESIEDIYIKEIFEVDGPFKFISFKKADNTDNDIFNLKFSYKGQEYNETAEGDGPLETCLNALEKAGFRQKLVHYEQAAFGEETKGAQADAMTVIQFETQDGKVITCRGKDPSTQKANVKAIFNGLNLIYTE
ncbi:MAG TPA: alpha-isopropylmalate synthase regulatory domain-containing protein [Candidatus Gastranaerophilales bacterium]|nr:alpha-isopropylmalate synthase regulatory domain-containing protein [Candidatus Gastranaerophilales bacterium]